MLSRPILNRSAWRRDTADPRSSWYLPLPDGIVAELQAFLAGWQAEGLDVTEFQPGDDIRKSWGEALAPARRELEEGRGFVIIDRLPVEQLSVREATVLYWLIGQLLGVPFVQNVEGTLLYDVRDTGKDLASGARFSVTNYESSFHTDNSFGDTILDYVGLLCLKTARSGGVSQNVSGCAVHNVLLEEHPDVLDTLYQPFHVDRRGGVQHGESPTVRRPVIVWDGSELVFRYLRHWIEVGHEKAAEPLTRDERRALDVLDGVLRRPELRVEFALEPGQMYFINNRWILHNRTAFEDHPDPELRRHLVRLWLRAKGGGEA
jgi:alpha-ketoglutarate-dependent taurine dioxygenase